MEQCTIRVHLGRKKYFNKENGSLSKEIVKIRMNMYKTKSNYKTKYANLTCPRYHGNKDTTEHVVHCYTGVSSERAPE